MIDTLNIAELSDEVKNLKSKVGSIVEVPEPETTDEGKVIGVNDDGEYELIDPPTGLPEVETTDEGKVLTVNDEGEWEAQTPAGGGASYGTFAQYYEEYGSNNIDVQLKNFVEAIETAIETAGVYPTTPTIANYKIVLASQECELVKFNYNNGTGKIVDLQFNYKEYNTTNNNFDTIAFYYRFYNNAQTATVYKTSYKTSGITVSDISYMGMTFTGTYYRLLKLS